MVDSKLAAVLLLLCGSALAQINRSPIIEIGSGLLQGNEIVMEDPAGIVYSFWNVPYAAPPVGDLRFALPQPPQPWEGVRYSESYGAACPGGRSLFLLTQPAFNNFAEDCLYLNVFTGNITAGVRNPVMVFFHGGGYVSGGSMQYPGHFLARDGVVVVTVNYRIGHLGFLTTNDAVAPGNWGLYDQNLALQWVQFNIEAFGGDRDSVTIFGQSAGAASSSLHIISPKSRGLFHRAIMESGTDFSLWAVNWPVQDTANYTRQVAEKFDCPTADSQELVNCLRLVPWEVLWNTSFICTPGTFCQGMAPVIDGPAGFIPDHPLVLREKGLINHVPIITGLNREDGSLYTYWLLPDTSGGFNRSEFERNLRDNLLVFFTAMFPPEREEDVFNAINWYYSPWPHVDDVYANRDAFNFMVTDAGFGYAADSQAKHQSQTNPAYFYIFGFRSSNLTSLIPEWMGVPHMCELPYVFGYPLLQNNPMVRRDTKIIDIIRWNDEDIAYARYFMPMLTNFAKYSNPTPEPIVPPTGGPGLTWPVYNGHYRDDLDLKYLLVDNVTNEIRTDYRQHAYSFFHEYMPYFAGYGITPPNTPIPPSEGVAKQTQRRLPKMPPVSDIKHSPIKRQGMDSNWFNDAVDAFIEEIFEKADLSDDFEY